MSGPANRIVQKLWSHCSVLRDDGLSYQDYLEQLTFLLFLEMAALGQMEEILADLEERADQVEERSHRTSGALSWTCGRRDAADVRATSGQLPEAVRRYGAGVPAATEGEAQVGGRALWYIS